MRYVHLCLVVSLPPLPENWDIPSGDGTSRGRPARRASGEERCEHNPNVGPETSSGSPWLSRG